MKQIGLGVAAKFARLSGREKIYVYAALLVISVYIVFALAVDPAQRRAGVLRKQIVNQKAEIENLRGSGGPLQKALDPNPAQQAKNEELQRSIEELDAKLKEMERDLVSADRMKTVLQEMLARDRGLQLVSLRTLPVVSLIAKAPEQAAGRSGKSEGAPQAGSPSANVYRHGVEITVRGKYTNLHEYLVRLERAPWRMIWSRAQLTAGEDAELTMTITIHTLSLDRGWLQV
jgi:MSHA biogenesis protein MshJ